MNPVTENLTCTIFQSRRKIILPWSSQFLANVVLGMVGGLKEAISLGGRIREMLL